MTRVWIVRNRDNFKTFCHPEHNVGHGKSTLASVLAMFNMIALLMQSACRMDCERWWARGGARATGCRTS